MKFRIKLADPALPLSSAALFLPPLAVLAPLGIAPLAAAAASLLVIQSLLVYRRWLFLDLPSLILLAFFIAWSTATAFWSPEPDRSFFSALRIGVIILGGLLLIGAARHLGAGQRQPIARALAIGSAIAAVLLAMNFATDISINRLLVAPTKLNPLTLINRAMSVVPILCWPLALLAGRWAGGVGVAAILSTAFVFAWLGEPFVPVIAFACGLIVFGLSLFASRAAAVAICSGLIFVAFLVPATPNSAHRIDTMLTEHGVNENSISHRLGIWTFTTEHILERPLTGWGFDAARFIPGGKDNLLIRGEKNENAPALPLHPHNAIFQIWLEAGLPALIIAFIFVCRGIMAIPRLGLDRAESAMLLATAASATIIANLSYGIWQGWWQCFLWLSAALALAIVQPAQER